MKDEKEMVQTLLLRVGEEGQMGCGSTDGWGP
jgi:hypothetical protein